MKPPNLAKRLRKWAAPVVPLVMGLLLERLFELFLPADIKTGITLFLGIPPGLIIIAVAAILSGTFIVWVLRSDDPQFPIIFGGWRLRRLIPLIDMLSLAKEHASSDENAYGVTHHATAVELTDELKNLRVPCPDLTVRHRPPFPSLQRDNISITMAFLKRLRFYCLDRDLKGAQEYGEKIVAWLNRTPNA